MCVCVCVCVCVCSVCSFVCVCVGLDLFYHWHGHLPQVKGGECENDNDNISVLLLALSAAFDTVDHQIIFSRPLFWAFSLMYSNGFSHISQTDISPPQVTITAHVRCASGISTGARSLRPVLISLRHHTANHQLFCEMIHSSRNPLLSMK